MRRAERPNSKSCSSLDDSNSVPPAQHTPKHVHLIHIFVNTLIPCLKCAPGIPNAKSCSTFDDSNSVFPAQNTPKHVRLIHIFVHTSFYVLLLGFQTQSLAPPLTTATASLLLTLRPITLGSFIYAHIPLSMFNPRASFYAQPLVSGCIHHSFTLAYTLLLHSRVYITPLLSRIHYSFTLAYTLLLHSRVYITLSLSRL